MAIFNELTPADAYSLKCDIVAGIVCLLLVAVCWVLFEVILTYDEPETIEACGRYDYCPDDE